jgi:hypothetical protein
LNRKLSSANAHAMALGSTILPDSPSVRRRNSTEKGPNEDGLRRQGSANKRNNKLGASPTVPRRKSSTEKTPVEDNLLRRQGSANRRIILADSPTVPRRKSSTEKGPVISGQLRRQGSAKKGNA